MKPGDNLQKLLGYEFIRPQLLDQALLHAGAAPEGSGVVASERLEFLGDRVLGLVVSDALLRQFPDDSEGSLARRLSALVDGGSCARVAEALRLGDFVKTCEKTPEARGRQTVMADSMEAVIGAIYLDGGFGAARDFILGKWRDMIVAVRPDLPAKSALQEWAQGRGKALPAYEIIDRAGPDHAPLFTVRVTIRGYSGMEAQGRSRQEAESRAAAKLLEALAGK